MNMDRIIENLYVVSEDLNKITSGLTPLKNGFLSKGVYFEDFEEAKRYHDKEINFSDFRNKSIDNVVIELAYNNIMKQIKSFYQDDKNDDNSFCVFLGCSINIYYSSGLYERKGKFAIDKISEYVSISTTKKYTELMSEYIYTHFCNAVINSFEMLQLKGEEVQLDEYFEQLEHAYREQIDAKQLELKIVNIVDNGTELFLPAIFGYIKENGLNKPLKNLDGFLDEMISVNSEIKFAYIYKSFESIDKYYKTDGKDTSFFDIYNKLGKELFMHIIDKKQLDQGNFVLESNEIIANRPGLFSNFGIGMPKIIIKNEDEKRFNNEINTFKPCCIRIFFEEALCIPITIYAHGNALFMALTALAQVTNIEKKLKKAIEDKDSIVRDFSHTCQVFGTDGIYHIAKTLLKSEDQKIKELGRKAYLEYNEKETLLKDAYMVKLKFENNTDELKNKMIDSIIRKDSLPNKFETIDNIVEESIKTCLFKAIYNGNDKLGQMLFREINGIVDDPEKLIASFEDEVVRSENLSAKEWLNTRFEEFSVLVSGNWKDVKLYCNDYGVIFLRGLITELIINILKYADKSQLITINFFDENVDLLAIEVTNWINNNAKNYGSGKGLKAKNESLRSIDGELTTENIENRFVTKIVLQKKLFVE